MLCWRAGAPSPMLFLLLSCGFWDFQENIPSLLGRMEDSSLRLPLQGMGMSTLPKGRILGTGDHQAGPNEPPGEDGEHAGWGECQR